MHTFDGLPYYQMERRIVIGSFGIHKL